MLSKIMARAGRLVRQSHPLLFLKTVQLLLRPRFVPGKTKVLGWNVEYVDARALASCMDVLLAKGWNDFTSENNNPVIYDCGANIGMSVLNYRRLYPHSRVLAFEPDPKIAAVLRGNLARNKASDVEVVQAAVWIKSGVISFFMEGADGSRVLPDVEGKSSAVTVPCIDFAEFIKEPIDLLKMDIEGAEFTVVPHISSKLHLVKNLVVECHLNNNRIDDFANLLLVLQASGFRVAVNTYGAWRDLVRRPPKAPNEFDQYAVVAAWREAW
jgi:FkbM family methyltransferase